MNKKVHRLDTDFELEFDFILIGISSTLKDYRLCHFVNKYSGLNFIFGKEEKIDNRGNKKQTPQEELDYHIIHTVNKNKKKEVHHFKTYRYCSQNFEREYYLLSNKGLEGRYLIPETPNFDAFLIIKHFIDEEDMETLMDDINRINGVLLVKEIDPKVLNSKENLIF